jgi:hypothetical protein
MIAAGRCFMALLPFAVYIPDGHIARSQRDTLAFVAENPVQVVLDVTARRPAGKNIEWAGNGIGLLGDGFDPRDKTGDVGLFRDADHAGIGRGIGEAAVAERAGVLPTRQTRS